MDFFVKRFQELTSIELYEILRLRAEVFVVEQDCVYQDVDGNDEKALHILGIKNNEVVAYARIFDQGLYFEEASIGRVVVAEKERRFKYGHALIDTSIEAVKAHYKVSCIKISAQIYLKKFYESHGFVASGANYLEDNIPHVAMYWNES